MKSAHILFRDRTVTKNSKKVPKKGARKGKMSYNRENINKVTKEKKGGAGRRIRHGEFIRTK